MVRTKDEMFLKMRHDLKEYGVEDSNGKELSDDQILEVSSLFQDGFTVIANEFRIFTEKVGVIFSSIGMNMKILDIVINDKNAKKNQN